MTKTLLLILVNIYATTVFAQSRQPVLDSLSTEMRVRDSLQKQSTTDSLAKRVIIDSLDKLNRQVLNTPADRANGMIITHRALNVFFADKVASYLSDGGDLSLFSNYATLSSSDGKFSINHSFANRKLDRVRGLWTVGAKANIAEGFAALYESKQLKTDLGITVKKTWISRGVVAYDNSRQPQNASETNQKGEMDVERAYILRTLETQINQKGEEIDSAVARVFRYNDIRLQVYSLNQIDSMKNALVKKKYDKLMEEYDEEFAKQQAKKLGDLKKYKWSWVGWTSLGVYIPVTPQKYTVAPNFSGTFADEKTYPWEATLSFNGVYEQNSFAGRFFGSLVIGIGQNNSAKTKDVEKTTKDQYVNLIPVEVDTLLLGKLKSDEVYIGSFSQFVTPVLRGQLVWFPNGGNIGISLQADKSFGKYDPLNAKIGVPIRLKNQEGKTNVNFELQVRFADLSNSIKPDKSRGDKTSIGVSVGLPFSSLLY